LNEETAFWTFVQMLKKYGLAPFFTDGIHPVALREFCTKFEQRLPKVDRHLKDHGGDVAIFGVQWFRTLFALDFDLSVAFRLWDLFFARGLSFVGDFIITMFVVSQEEILAQKEGELLIFVKELPLKYQQEDRWDDLIRLSLRSDETVRNFASLFANVLK